MCFSGEFFSFPNSKMVSLMLKYHVRELRGPKTVQSEIASRAAQKEAAGRIWPMGCSLHTPDLDTLRTAIQSTDKAQDICVL